MGGSAPKPTQPRVVRMPNEEDPAAIAAARRRKEATLQRRGRLSTIMTDQNRERAGTGGGGNPTIGSSGQKLGV